MVLRNSTYPPDFSCSTTNFVPSLPWEIVYSIPELICSNETRTPFLLRNLCHNSNTTRNAMTAKPACQMHDTLQLSSKKPKPSHHPMREIALNGIRRIAGHGNLLVGQVTGGVGGPEVAGGGLGPDAEVPRAQVQKAAGAAAPFQVRPLVLEL